TVFIFSVTQFQFMMDKTQAEESALLLSFYTRTFLSQALDLRPAVSVSGTGLSGAAGASERGYLDYDFDALRHFGTTGNHGGGIGLGQSAPISLFNREWGYNESNNDTTIPTGIFFTDRNRNAQNFLDRSITVAFVPTDTGGVVFYDDSAIRFE